MPFLLKRGGVFYCFPQELLASGELLHQPAACRGAQPLVENRAVP